MILTAILTALPILTVILEMALGIAYFDWFGCSDSLVVEREKAPAKYWLIVVIHMLFAIGLPILAWNSPLFGPR